jgi:D-amino-acid oxidase
VYPIRGQTIIVYSPNIKECISVVRGGEQLFISPDGLSLQCVISGTTKSEKSTYFIPRASTPGMVLIGGTFEPNNWDTSISIPTADGILARAKEVVPALNDPTTRIHAHNVGLRPAREGGPRVEAQFIDVPSKDNLIPRPASAASADTKTRLVVHAYGFG